MMARSLRASHHPFGGGRHHLREQTAFAQRVVQRGSSTSSGVLPAATMLGLVVTPASGKMRASFYRRNVRCVEIKFHDVPSKLA
jgi:hypothetical protein